MSVNVTHTAALWKYCGTHAEKILKRALAFDPMSPGNMRPARLPTWPPLYEAECVTYPSMFKQSYFNRSDNKLPY